VVATAGGTFPKTSEAGVTVTAQGEAEWLLEPPLELPPALVLL
jgi:hypothetical protein